MWNLISYIIYPVTYWFKSDEDAIIRNETEYCFISLTPHSFAPLPENKIPYTYI